MSEWKWKLPLGMISAPQIYPGGEISTPPQFKNNFYQIKTAGRSSKAELKYALQFLMKKAATSLMELRSKQEKEEEGEELQKSIRAFHGERNIMFTC